MSLEAPPTTTRTTLMGAVRHHLVLVAVCLALGALGGWAYAGSSPTTYTSSVRILVNPAVGNPYAPTPASVRQDELTSLETEAQMVRSAEVLDAVATPGTGPTASELASRLQVTVPPNTQILEISYSAREPDAARSVADAVADAYLDNRAARFGDVQDARITRVENQTVRTIEDLRAATAAAQVGTPARRAFNAELADALRNELVSLRAQRSSLENSESPVGAVISPASPAQGSTLLNDVVLPVGGALAGLAIGCLLALALERSRGVVRTPAEVESAGLPVIAAVPATRHHRGASRSEPVETAVRRLRAGVLGLEPRPQVLAVTPADKRESPAEAARAVAHSFARAGHPVVLVRHDGEGDTSGLVDKRGLADALVYERLNVSELLQPSVEPLLSVLDEGGFTAESRELLTGGRLRVALSPLVEDGLLVVLPAPAADGTERDAYLGASDLALVVVTAGHTRRRAVERLAALARGTGDAMRAFVVGSGDLAHVRESGVASEPDSRPRASTKHGKASRIPR